MFAVCCASDQNAIPALKNYQNDIPLCSMQFNLTAGCVVVTYFIGFVQVLSMLPVEG